MWQKVGFYSADHAPSRHGPGLFGQQMRKDGPLGNYPIGQQLIGGLKAIERDMMRMSAFSANEGLDPQGAALIQQGYKAATSDGGLLSYRNAAQRLGGVEYEIGSSVLFAVVPGLELGRAADGAESLPKLSTTEAEFYKKHS